MNMFIIEFFIVAVLLFAGHKMGMRFPKDFPITTFVLKFIIPIIVIAGIINFLIK